MTDLWHAFALSRDLGRKLLRVMFQGKVSCCSDTQMGVRHYTIIARTAWWNCQRVAVFKIRSNANVTADVLPLMAIA